MSSSQGNKASLKLAQLHKALYHWHSTTIRAIEKILEKEGDINYAVPVVSVSTPQKFLSRTALHFACSYGNLDVTKKLLSLGADFTIKNGNEETVIHFLFNCWSNTMKPIEEPILIELFSAHISTNNSSNPCNKNGLSHFHIACMMKNFSAVQFFLENGVSVDESVDASSSQFPGFTPMHIAATCTNTKVAKILLAYGANVYIADVSGKTPLHVLIERRMAMFDSMSYCMYSEGSYENLQELIQENEEIINMLMENMSTEMESLDSIGLSNFHVSCMLQDVCLAENLADRVANINQCVNKDSPLWPGYTALHFAAHFNVRTVKMLIKKGADIQLQDSKGCTPFDIFIERYRIEDICKIISLNAKWKNILFSDGKTKLLSILQVFTDKVEFKSLISSSNFNLDMIIPMDSTLWPGFTILHLTILFIDRPKIMFYELRDIIRNFDLQLIRICLKEKASLCAQDAEGRTPLHLAYRLDKISVVDVLLHQRTQILNVFDKDNLSHLHIACAPDIKNAKLEKILLKKSDVNVAYKGTSPANIIQPGWTPLHVCTSLGKDDTNEKVSTLLKYKADPCIKDVFGLTPIHWLLNNDYLSSCMHAAHKLLENSNDCVVEKYGMSHVHIACTFGFFDEIKRFLENGSDVNLAIDDIPRSEDDPLKFLSEYAKYTPLHHLIGKFYQNQNLELLLNHGADLFAENAKGTIPIADTNILDYFIRRLKNNFELRACMELEFGWTMLHFACQVDELFQLNEFEDIVMTNLSAVNAKVFSNSPIWKGYTPLHVIVSRAPTYYTPEAREKLFIIIKILLENGGNVNVVNDEQNSPIGMLFKTRHGENDITALLMKYQKDFDINPVNARGISHFHIACYLNDVDAVEGFLLHGANVNHPIDYFSEWNPGCTSLHLATNFQVIDLLIKYGADVHAEDVYGSTVLHKAFESDNFDENFIAKIIEAGANINCSNIRNNTPFQNIISKSGFNVDKLTLLIRQGFPVNSCNPITGVGYISSILEECYIEKNTRYCIVEKIMTEKSTTILGRNTFHHFVSSTRIGATSSSDYIFFFQKLLKSDHDIDEQDDEGKTPLHLAVECKNLEAIIGLMSCGADINILDKNGMSPLSIITSEDKLTSDIRNRLSSHAIKMWRLELELHQVNKDAVCRVHFSISFQRTFHRQIALSKEMHVGVRSISLHDFLSETGAIVIYPSLNQLERFKLAEFFVSVNSDDRFEGIRSILNLQYRKAVTRSELHFPAMNCLRSLLGFDLPDLCVEGIFIYLWNCDLKNIIKSAHLENEKMNVD